MAVARPSSPGTCDHCGAALTVSSRFCAGCGAPTAAEGARQQTDRAGDRTELQRRRDALQSEVVASAAAARSVGVLFAGVLAAPFLVALLLGDQDSWQLLSSATQALQIGAGLVALRVLGWEHRHATVPWRATPGQLALALPAAAVSLAAAWAWVAMMIAGLELDGQAEPSFSLASAAFDIVLVAPLVEEWICRGVLFCALSRLASLRGAIVATALLFALMHGLNGGYLLELPHRFVMGLVLGWLRVRTGSLSPGVLTHALHNLVVLASG